MRNAGLEYFLFPIPAVLHFSPPGHPLGSSRCSRSSPLTPGPGAEGPPCRCHGSSHAVAAASSASTFPSRLKASQGAGGGSEGRVRVAELCRGLRSGHLLVLPFLAFLPCPASSPAERHLLALPCLAFLPWTASAPEERPRPRSACGLPRESRGRWRREPYAGWHLLPPLQLSSVATAALFCLIPASGRHRPACRSLTCWSYGKG